MTKVYELRSPTGTVIEGTLETLSGKAGLGHITGRNPDGTFDFEHDGGTEVFWDDQRTVVLDGHRVFVDGDGTEFTEDQLALVEVEEKANG